jgi:hypothetical protein
MEKISLESGNMGFAQAESEPTSDAFVEQAGTKRSIKYRHAQMAIFPRRDKD